MPRASLIAGSTISVLAAAAETVAQDLASGDNAETIMVDAVEAAFKRLVWQTGGHPTRAVGAVVTLPAKEADAAIDARDARPASAEEIAHHLGVSSPVGDDT